MNAGRYLKSVIVLYISIHGDKYLLVGVYLDMTGNNVDKNTNEVYMTGTEVKRRLWYCIYK